MPLPNRATSLIIADTGGASPFTFNTDDISVPSQEDIRDEVELANRFTVKIGYRKSFSFRSYLNGDGANGFAHMSTLQDLYAASLAGTEKELTINYDGTSNNAFVWDPVVLTVRPMLDLGNKAKIWIHDAQSGVPTVGYDDLGPILFSSPEFGIETLELGDRRQCYLDTTMEWTLQLKEPTFLSTIEAHTGNLKVAVDLGDTTYLTIDNVVYDAEYGATEQIITNDLRLTGRWQDPRDGTGDRAGIAWPASPAKFLFGFMVDVWVSAQTRADVLTVT